MWFLQSLACGFIVWFVLVCVTFIIAVCKRWKDDVCVFVGTANIFIGICSMFLYASIKLLFYN
jgi:hypothetical protein